MNTPQVVLTARALGQTWAGIPGVELTPGGRLLVSCFSGGDTEPHPENTAYLTSSDDGGRTFGAPVAIVLPRSGTRVFDPTLWLDPLGRLWLIVNRGNKDAADHAVYARLCADLDAALRSFVGHPWPQIPSHWLWTPSCQPITALRGTQLR